MKNLLLFLAFMILCYGKLFSQEIKKSTTKDFLWSYELPSSFKNGPEDILVRCEYYFTKESLGNKYLLKLHSKIVSIEHQSKFGYLRYRLNGKSYRQDQMNAIDGLGTKGFDELYITSVGISIDIFGLKPFVDKILRSGYVGDNITYNVAEVSMDRDLSSLILETSASYLKNINWNNSQTLENRIYNLNKPKEKENLYKPKSLPSLTASSNSSSKPNSKNSNSSNSNKSSSSSSSSNTSANSKNSSSSSSSSSSNGSSSTNSKSTSSIPYDPELLKSDAQKREEAMGKLFLNTYNSINAIAAEIRQNRERKQAQREREQALARVEYEKFMAKVTAEKVAYLELVAKYDESLKNQDFYSDKIVNKLQNTIKASTVSWSIFIANASFPNLFGKDIDFVHKKINRCCTHLKKQISKGDSNHFRGISSQFLKFVDVEQENLLFWYNGEFEVHYRLNLLFNENNIMTGLEIELDTDRMNSKKYINQYLNDLKIALADDCIQLSGNTFLTKDKLFILDFGFLRMFDLKYFKPDTHFLSGENFLSKLFGIKLKGERIDSQNTSSRVVVENVLHTTTSENNTFLKGDIILKIDDIEVTKPYEVEMYLLGANNKIPIRITIERNNKVQTIFFNN